MMPTVDRRLLGSPTSTWLRKWRQAGEMRDPAGISYCTFCVRSSTCAAQCLSRLRWCCGAGGLVLRGGCCRLSRLPRAVRLRAERTSCRFTAANSRVVSVCNGQGQPAHPLESAGMSRASTGDSSHAACHALCSARQQHVVYRCSADLLLASQDLSRHKQQWQCPPPPPGLGLRR